MFLSTTPKSDSSLLTCPSSALGTHPPCVWLLSFLCASFLFLFLASLSSPSSCSVLPPLSSVPFSPPSFGSACGPSVRPSVPSLGPSVRSVPVRRSSVRVRLSVLSPSVCRPSVVRLSSRPFGSVVLSVRLFGSWLSPRRRLSAPIFRCSPPSRPQGPSSSRVCRRRPVVVVVVVVVA